MKMVLDLLNGAKIIICFIDGGGGGGGGGEGERDTPSCS